MNYVITLIGARGCGKTTYIRKLIDKMRAKNKSKKVLIVDTLDHPAYRDIPVLTIAQLKAWKPNAGGFYRIYGSNTAEIFEAVNTSIYNALIIFEDASKYVGTEKLNPDIRGFLFDSKQKNLDVIFLFHAWGFVPNDLFRINDMITFFKTKDNPEAKKNFLPFDLIKAEYNTVQSSSDKYINRTIQIN
jgi:GTPase SAR1 family protein